MRFVKRIIVVDPHIFEQTGFPSSRYLHTHGINLFRSKCWTTHFCCVLPIVEYIRFFDYVWGRFLRLDLLRKEWLVNRFSTLLILAFITSSIVSIPGDLGAIFLSATQGIRPVKKLLLRRVSYHSTMISIFTVNIYKTICICLWWYDMMICIWYCLKFKRVELFICYLLLLLVFIINVIFDSSYVYY